MLSNDRPNAARLLLIESQWCPRWRLTVAAFIKNQERKTKNEE